MLIKTCKLILSYSKWNQIFTLETKVKGFHDEVGWRTCGFWFWVGSCSGSVLVLVLGWFWVGSARRWDSEDCSLWIQRRVEAAD